MNELQRLRTYLLAQPFIESPPPGSFLFCNLSPLYLHFRSPFFSNYILDLNIYQASIYVVSIGSSLAEDEKGALRTGIFLSTTSFMDQGTISYALLIKLSPELLSMS